MKLNKNIESLPYSNSVTYCFGVISKKKGKSDWNKVTGIQQLI